MINDKCFKKSSQKSVSAYDKRANIVYLTLNLLLTMKMMMKRSKMDYWLLIFSLIFVDVQRVCCLFVTDLNVPEIVDFRDNVTLSCSYEMSGHTLNSVKWYKDKMEFFRYSPMMHPVYIKFPVTGVYLPDGKYFCNESSCKVELSMLSAKSSGVYKCEVSGDAPHFQLAAKEDNMTVAALPQSDPLIESFNPMYRMEDYLSATCTSDYSSVPTRLTWYINGEQASLGELQPNVDTSISAHGYILRRIKLQVHFYLSGPRFFHAGKILNLKCVSEIENFPELARETSLNAVLIPYDNLNNQMLIHAGSNGSPSLTPASNYAHSILTAIIIRVIFLTSSGLRRL